MADLIGSDGLPARESHDYAEDKLHYVSRYMDIFATGMRKKWARRVYLDLMARPGLCRIKESGREFLGSPLRSFDVPFTHRLFVEASPTMAAALRKRVPNQEAEVIEADCNAMTTIDRLRRATEPRGTLSLAFIDNLGLDVPFETIAALTADRSTDLLIVVQLQDLTRNVRLAVDGRQDAGRLDAFFGSPDWATIVGDFSQFNARAAEVTNALVTFYLERFRTIGYHHALQSIDVMKNRQNAAQYRLVIVSRHPRALEFFRKIEAIDPHGQRPLFQ